MDMLFVSVILVKSPPFSSMRDVFPVFSVCFSPASASRCFFFPGVGRLPHLFCRGPPELHSLQVDLSMRCCTCFPCTIFSVHACVGSLGPSTIVGKDRFRYMVVPAHMADK